jgi:uncharacterized repeat protein (TIGR01451 family)
MLADNVLSDNQPLQSLAPNGAASLAFDVRDVETGITIRVLGRSSDSSGWFPNFSAGPDSIIYYKIVVTNSGDTALSEIRLEDSLPPSVAYVSGSSTLFDPDHPKGTHWHDGIVDMADPNAGLANYIGIGLPPSS